MIQRVLRMFTLRVGMIGMLAMILWISSGVWITAYDYYYDPSDPDEAGNCKNCHPSFNQKGDLHDMHVSPFTSLCYPCHINQKGDNPLISKKDVSGEFGCMGCHGRDYGRRTALGNPIMEGHGLLSRHVRYNGVTICLDCHKLNTESLPETNLPPHYGTSDVASTLVDPCNPGGGEDGDESWKSPDPEPETLGLDNDGDGILDMSDPDCVRGTPSRIVNLRFQPGVPDILSWTVSSDADSYQVLRGSLSDLQLNPGDFGNAICVDTGSLTNSFEESSAPTPGDGWYYLVRGAGSGSVGTYESDGPRQVGERDTTATACP